MPRVMTRSLSMTGDAVRAFGKRHATVFLHERMFPKPFPIRSEARENSLRSLHVNVARLRIDRRDCSWRSADK